MMTARRTVPSTVSLGLLALIAACGEDTDKPTSKDYEEIAHNIAPLISKELAADGGLMLATKVAAGEAPAWLSIQADGEAHRGALGPLMWEVLASCTDGNGTAMVACSETATAAQVTSSLRGSLELPNFSAELAADINWSVSGLQSDVILAKGRTSVHAETHFTGPLRPATSSFELDFFGNYNVSVPRNAPELASGFVQATVDAHRIVSGTEREGEAHFKVDAHVSLDGKGSATLTLDGNAQFQLNLETGRVEQSQGSRG